MYKIIQGDCLETLKDLPSGIVQTCVTSPPYYGLRDYQTAKWEGGDSECDHLLGKLSSDKSTLHPAPEKKKMETGIPYKGICAKCGAVRIDNQIGLEETPEAYVSKLVEVFREVKRVLKEDGTLWLIIGDSYAGNGQGWSHSEKQKSNTGAIQYGPDNVYGHPPGYISSKQPNGLKPKDLIGIPWMVAFALRADGWYLRSDIIWAKPNPMPESVTDRCTKAHEYIFMLSKSKSYYYDAEAIKEPSLDTGGNGALFGHQGGARDTAISGGKGTKENRPYGLGRNKRDVWTVTTKPYKEAHFATFPPDLIEPCILSGSKIGDTVLDPFGGAGTTALVALKHGRDAILCELNPNYIELTKKRLNEVQPKLNGL